MYWNNFKKEKNQEERIMEAIEAIEKPEKDTITKTCEICGKEFEVNETYAKITKYCSEKCRKKRNAEAKKEYAARYYREKTLKKRQELRDAKATIIASGATNMDFFKKTEFALEIMKVAGLKDELSLRKLIVLIEKYVG